MTQASTLSLSSEKWLSQYERHLECVTGATSTTREKYLYFASRFLASVPGSPTPNWSALEASHITTYVEREAAPRRNHGRKDPGVAIRSFMRYLIAEGLIHAGLTAAVPIVREFRMAPLPRHLADDQIERVLTACSASPQDSRDFAIVLLLARLGLRGKEVARLTLDDVDWRRGQLVVRHSKSHRERLLPISQEIGDALVTYIREARPHSTERYLFLSKKPPYRPLLKSYCITQIVKRLLPKAGVPAKVGGAHLFRHTAATQMLRRGASFKDIADVLGHKAIGTTAIYAKLDLAALSLVALPCPGGEQ